VKYHVLNLTREPLPVSTTAQPHCKNFQQKHNHFPNISQP